MEPSSLDEKEVDALLDDLLLVCGLDYREYESKVVKARIGARLAAEGLASVRELRARILDDKSCLERLVADLSGRPRRPFADPAFSRLLREQLAPRLRTYPSARIWHPYCGTGEEAYETAIALFEVGTLPRSTIYATDPSELLVERARDGRSDLDVEACEESYRQAGGTATLSEYYQSDGGAAQLRPALAARLVFATHSFATDASINEFQLIVCRGVLSQFSPSLQERAHRVLFDSLCRFGFLALAEGESVRRSPYREQLESVGWGPNLYRRIP